MRKKVLGINVDDITMDQAVKTVKGWLAGKSFDFAQDKHYIVTTNPEFIITAQEDPIFKKILKDADLSIPDGVGLKLFGGVKNRILGVDFMEKLVELASDQAFTVGFLGGGAGVAEKTAECLMKKYPRLKVSFISSGGQIPTARGPVSSQPHSMSSTRYRSLRALNGAPRSLPPPELLSIDFAVPRTDLLFVAFGHPKQEYWIYENLSKLPVKVAMGVGGSFDYISGKVPRAPLWIREIGLEWLFRLIEQPWRIKRQTKLLKYIFMLIFNRN